MIFWIVVTFTCGPCPDAVTKDEFGRVSYYDCLVCHEKTDTVTMSKSFERLDSAKAFYSRLKKVEDIMPPFAFDRTTISGVTIK